ncbi:MAG: two-component sensor histidine kinase [Alphaproteobacteria bacterium]|nr:two-component sensor histidine kinase [Alphaproteobacteria bacterium]
MPYELKSAELIKERERLHSRLMNSVSHDLKTPLACIIGSLEIYQRTKDKLSEEKKSLLLNTALQEAYRLDGFITNILDMAKLESGAVIIKKEHCSIDYLLEDCKIRLAKPLCNSTVHINTNDTHKTLHTDPFLLMRAICILLDNAAKYGPPNPTIHINYKNVDEHITLQIEDNGTGVPHEKLKGLFSKDSRLRIQDRTQSGTGLGLSICREIMRLLDGTISVANRIDGKGAIFTLNFAA